MIPVFQTDTTLDNGDCLSACIASILEIKTDEVPNFVNEARQQPGAWYFGLLTGWLSYKGYSPILHRLEEGKIVNNWIVPANSWGIAMGFRRNDKEIDSRHAIIIKTSMIMLRDIHGVPTPDWTFDFVHDPDPNSKSTRLWDSIDQVDEIIFIALGGIR